MTSTARPITLATGLVAALALAAPAALAAPPAAPDLHAKTAKVALHRAPLTRKALRKARPVAAARAATVSNAWGGDAHATCVGTSIALSMGRSFGLPLGVSFRWRSRLVVFNPRTGTQTTTPYGPWMNDVMPNPSGYIYLPGGGAIFVMGPSGLILPAYSPTAAWTSNGNWVSPYVQVDGHGERPVNITDIAGAGRWSAPNWCYLG